MTQEELDEFKLNAKKNYKKVNQHIRNKCKLCKLGDEPDCRECDFDFSKFLMRSTLPEKDGICRKCNKWLTDRCYNQGNPENNCTEIDRRIKTK